MLIPVIIIKVLAGGLIGFGCKYAVCRLADILLERRGFKFAEIPIQQTFLTVILAFIGAAIAAFVPLSAETAFLYLFLIILGTLSITDIQYRKIPNDMLIAILAVTLAFGIPTLFGAKGFHPFSIKGALIGMAALLVLFILPGLFKKNVGAGDIKLAACIGFSLGLSNSLVCVVLMGVLVLIYTLLQRRIPALQFVKSMIPMGPFISIAAMAVAVAFDAGYINNLFSF